MSYPDDPTDILRDVLKLDRIDADETASTFTGYTPPQTRGQVFGGQVMAQSLVAASHTVDADRFVHSMHCYFIRPGDATQPLHFTVDHHRDGRSLPPVSLMFSSSGAVTPTSPTPFSLAVAAGRPLVVAAPGITSTTA